MTALIWLAIALFILMAPAVAAWLFWRRSKPAAPDQNLFLMLQNQINEMSRVMDGKLSEANKMMQEQFGQSSRVIQSITGQSHQILKDVTERLDKLDETNKQVVGVGDQIKSLEAILKNPKQRGVLGEYYLENVLKNVLPPGSYEMQYKFSSG